MSDGDRLSNDRFLGGRLTIAQPAGGYRAGIDAVLLAAAVPARGGDTVLELGCGAGTAVLCLATRVPGVTLSALEVQTDYAALARANAATAGVALTVYEGDVAAPPTAFRTVRADHVMANPPFFVRADGTMAQDAGRESGRGESAPLDSWVACAARRLRPGGMLTIIQRATRLGEIMGALEARFGAVEILPIAARAGRQAEHVIVRARTDRRTPLSLLPPLVLHPGAEHAEDGGAYRPEVEKVLRNAAALPGLPMPSGG